MKHSSSEWLGMAWVSLVMLAQLSNPAVAKQVVPERTLEIADTFSEPFSRIRGVRELTDGKLLVADQTEVAVYLVDFTTGRRTHVGREGGGPNEYGMPTGLSWFPGDSSLLYDVQNSRIAVLTPDGNVASTFPNRQFGFFMGGMSADTNGSVYFDSRVGSEPRPVLRWHRPTNSLDTLTQLAPAERFQVDGRQWTVPWSVGDAWAVDRAGRLFVVRRDPYRVVVIDRDGTTREVVVDYAPFEVSAADRDAWNARPPVATVSTGGARPQLPRNWPFPEHFPPFVFRGAHTSPDGRLWVERQQSLEDTSPLLDVFDREGRLLERIRLPAGRSVVGFGLGTVYATREDDVGLLWLERYRT